MRRAQPRAAAEQLLAKGPRYVISLVHTARLQLGNDEIDEIEKAASMMAYERLKPSMPVSATHSCNASATSAGLPTETGLNPPTVPHSAI
jgi:hypothetical protein